MNQALRGALILDGIGTFLLVISILGYAGIPLHPLLAQPVGYLTCGGIGLFFAGLGILLLMQNLRSPVRREEERRL